MFQKPSAMEPEVMRRVGMTLLSFFAVACASSGDEHTAIGRTYQSVELVDLFENADRWDGVSVRTQGFAELVEYGSEPALMLHSASAAGSVEQSQLRCDVRDQSIFLPLSKEALGQVRELKIRKGLPRLVEVVGLFTTQGIRFYKGYVFTEYKRAIVGGDVPAIKEDVCQF